MGELRSLTSLRMGTILLTGLALSIGWGIRGNFGHEYGAMIPGALAALVVCLLSGRRDWRDRAPYFAFFGALGWAFGGSMSYMQVVAYTHSGHLPSQLFGFFGLFVLGFLWSCMGGAGTAFAAVASKDQLSAVFRPLYWIFAAWVFYQVLFQRYLETLFPVNFDPTWSRQAAHTYWFDSDWMETSFALLALLCFELWDNRARHLLSTRPIWQVLAVIGGVSLSIILGFGFFINDVTAIELGPTPAVSSWLIPGLVLVGVATGYLVFLMPLLTLFAAVGAILGLLVQRALDALEWTSAIADAVLHYQVSPEFVAHAAAERGISEAAVLADQLINWPNAVLYYPQYIGCFIGLLIGIGLYFFRFGRFASGASLFLYMCLGWFACFLLFPVLLGHPIYDGAMWFRMTPPRGDNWAGVLGVAIGTGIWLLRNGYVRALQAMLVTGFLGGTGFAGATLVKLMLVRPGNPEVETNPARVAYWGHWQQSNWHSVMEQTGGLFFGFSLAIAMGLLARNAGRNDGPPAERRCTTVFATGFVLFGVLYLNMHKNVIEWVNRDMVPEFMTAPLVSSVSLSAWTWFNLIFGIVAAAGLCVMIRHLYRPVALVPASALGRGQLLFITFLASVVLMNFERSLAGFAAARLITEGLIFFNATLAALCLLLLPEQDHQAPAQGRIHYGLPLVRTICFGLGAMLITTFGMCAIVRAAYGNAFAGHAGKQHRFGSEAEWRIKPTEKSSRHS